VALAVDTTTPHSNSSDAEWRAWGQAVHDALEAVGLVQTADSGQVDWTTSTARTAEMSATGGNGEYEIWRFADAQQATHPIFLKVWYGRSDSADQVRTMFQVGTGSDGSGTLTDPSSMGTVSSGPGSDTVRRRIHASFIDGALLLYVAPDDESTSSSSHASVTVERVRDENGNYDGRILKVGGHGNSAFCQIYDGSWSNIEIWSSARPVIGSEKLLVALWPVGCVEPMRTLAVVYSTDVAMHEEGTVTIDGDVLAMKGARSGPYFFHSNTTTHGFIGGLNSAGTAELFTAANFRPLYRNE
jgi:hypothetical protein